MPTPSIVKFISLADAGVFKGYTFQAGDVPLRARTLVYGYNGTGKTTLSRVVRSIEKGVRGPRLPQACKFTVEFDDATTCASTTFPTVPNPSIAVFNSDFVTDSFDFVAGKASAIFFIGEEQAALAKLKKPIEDAIRRREDSHAAAETAESYAEVVFRDFKRNAARSIAESLGERNYNATNLDANFAEIPANELIQLNEKERDVLLRLISQPSALPLLISTPIPAAQLKLVASKGVELCETNVETIVEGLSSHHVTMLPWLAQGHRYHGEHELGSCLFCNSELSATRKAELADLLNGELEQLISLPPEVIEDLRKLIEALRINATSLPSKESLHETLRAEYQTESDRFKQLSVKVVDALLSLQGDLGLKRRAINRAINPQARILLDDRGPLTALVKCGEGIAALLERHNEFQRTFDEEQRLAYKTLLRHFLSLAAEDYRRHKLNLVDASTNKRIRFLLLERMKRCKQAVETRLRSSGPALKRINELLNLYLGHNELTLRAVGEGFEIIRCGGEVANVLSEGERTALALCYFVSKLEEDGRRIKDTVVFVDDPISSLDTKCMNFVATLVKSALGSARQLIVSTHNLHFMSEIKRWLHRDFEREKDKLEADKTISFLYLDARQVEGTAQRQTTIVELPKLLRVYESEYHYNFWQVKRYADGQDADLTYMMPNTMRKVLELFLSFKDPGTHSLIDRLNRKLITDAKLHPDRMKALNRLLQSESHAQNLDDILQHRPITIEEARDSALAVLELIARVDSHHSNQMLDLCVRA